VLCLVVAIVVLVTGGVAPGARLRAVKVAPVDQSLAPALKINEQKQDEPFHGVDANSAIYFTKVHCTMSILPENGVSVRGYGSRAYKPRQGRNAATVV
jgi:hypothetical protein